ncbi:hypothetical protein HaLaN_29194 [Haematococcus lacustris]|uniref:Uncharacterized protein n=1 Tax=Haematococcus lacustris TaxID=44745 RepID=A0A6A0AC86_HAELA|nr:hypothetical protein HaLaN_29194 [Haematococcus lacustris]
MLRQPRFSVYRVSFVTPVSLAWNSGRAQPLVVRRTRQRVRALHHHIGSSSSHLEIVRRALHATLDAGPQISSTSIIQVAQLQQAPPALPNALHVQCCIAVPVQPSDWLWQLSSAQLLSSNTSPKQRTGNGSHRQASSTLTILQSASSCRHLHRGC